MAADKEGRHLTFKHYAPGDSQRQVTDVARSVSMKATEPEVYLKVFPSEKTRLPPVSLTFMTDEMLSDVS